jgi:type IV secretion system protein VirD4
MGVRTRIACLGVGALIGLSAATQIVAWRYQYQPALGKGIAIHERTQAKPTLRFYPPWNILLWQKKWGDKPAHQSVLKLGVPSIMLGIALGGLLVRLFDAPTSASGTSLAGGQNSRRRARGWGNPKDLIKAGLGGDEGVILGRIEPPSLTTDWFIWPRLLVSPDLRPALVTGGTRSGKGRGIVVPTLLNWNASTLVFDPKGELWDITSGYRHRKGPVLFFNPRNPATARFNPLAEIGTGRDCLAQVQRLVKIIVNHEGNSASQDFWDRQAGEMLSALIVHVLHCDGPKTLIEVKRLTANLDETVRAMLSTWHKKGGSGPGEVHPFVHDIATAYAFTHEKGRKSVQMTVRSYLTWLVGEDVENAVSTSDFRLGDLMCANAPVSLYVQIAPGDLKTLQPLVRMFFQLAATAFTTHIEADSDGLLKKHNLLLALDEFPLLGKVDFFEDVVRLASGYGIKCLFIAQSLNDISRVYGTHNGFIDNSHIYVAFAALDPLTREKVSKLTGMTTATRSSASLPNNYTDNGGSTSIGEYERPLLDPSEIGSLPDRNELVFIAGHRPYRLTKVRYDQIGWMKKRAKIPAHKQAEKLDTPERPAHPWTNHKPFGYGDPSKVKFSEDVARERQQADLAEIKADAKPTPSEFTPRNETGEPKAAANAEYPGPIAPIHNDNLPSASEQLAGLREG